MKLIMRYLKSHTLFVGLCLLLLLGQAICDLTLPNMMSDLVNTGIQQGGIEETVPYALSEDAMELVSFFMPADEKADFQASYSLINTGSSAAAKYVDDYPLLKTENVYIIHKDADTQAIDDTYGNATYSFLLFVQDKIAESGQTSAYDSESGLTSEDMTLLYEMIPQLEQAPSGSFDTYITQAAESDSMIRTQVGTAFTKMFYTEAGVDLDAKQDSFVMRTGVKMILVALAGAAATVLVGYYASRIAAKISRKMRRDVFSKVSSFSSAEFDKFSTASLITRTTNDISQVQMLILMGIRLMCYAPILGIGGIIMAVSKSVSLSWTIAVAVVVLLGIILVVFSIALPKFKLLQKLLDRVNLVSRENLSGLMVVRAFGNEKHEEERFEEANANLSNTNRFTQRTMAFLFPAMMFVMELVTIAIIWVGSHAIANSTLQIGDMMAFLQYAMQIIFAFLMISMMFIMVPRASVSASRIYEVLNTENKILDKATPLTLKNAVGNIAFKNVNFRYENAEDDVLSDITFVAKAGETTAFIGSTGSGKSTLVNLIPRFYDIQNGSITIDGIDIRDVAQKDLREIIGYIPQKGVLFSGDIASNIQFGKEDATEEEIAEAIEIGQAKEFVDSNEEGLAYSISQGGTNVSGGQKQRLAIARALVKKPPIYIFDDSFSALDFRTDAALRSALKEKTASSTVLIVAQRVTTIMHADQIIVLDNGKIVGIGDHDQLMESCEAYREIAESQLSKEELA